MGPERFEHSTYGYLTIDKTLLKVFDIRPSL